MGSGVPFHFSAPLNMARFFEYLSCVMVMFALLVASQSAFAMGDTSILETQTPKHYVPIVQNPSLLPIRNNKTQVVDIKLLQMRPTAGVVTGSILPFSIRDLRNTINPERRVAAASASTAPTTPATNPTAPTTPTSTITCPDGTQFPTAGSFANSILFNLPPTNGACSLTLGPTSGANSVFVVNTFTSVNAAISGVNGWAVNVSMLNSGFGAGASTTIQISKSGITYRLVLTVSNNLAGGGNITVSGFTQL